MKYTKEEEEEILREFPKKSKELDKYLRDIQVVYADGEYIDTITLDDIHKEIDKSMI